MYVLKLRGISLLRDSLLLASVDYNELGDPEFITVDPEYENIALKFDTLEEVKEFKKEFDPLNLLETVPYE